MHRRFLQGEKPRSSDSNERRCTTPAIRLPPERGPAITERANAFPHLCEGPRSRLLPLPSPSCDTPRRNLNSPRGAGDRATPPLAARRDPRGVRWPAPPAGQKKPAVPKPEGQCHWSRPGSKDVNAAISDDPAVRSKRSAATPTRLLRRFLLSRDGQVRWAHRSRNETVESEWPRCRTVESDAAANQRRSLRNLWEMARPTRFERVTFAFGEFRLSYAKMRWGKQCFAMLLKLLRKLESAAATPILLCAPISFQLLTWCLRGRRASSQRNSMAKLTKRIVDAAEAQDKDYVIWDDELPGFGLRVFTSGRRSYLIQYRSAGRSRRYTIGQHGVWTPELARKEAKVQLGRIAQGDNPAEERQLDHKAFTVKELCDLYLNDLKAGLILGKGGGPKKATTMVTDT